jgi:hypothetical protein
MFLTLLSVSETSPIGTGGYFEEEDFGIRLDIFPPI